MDMAVNTREAFLRKKKSFVMSGISQSGLGRDGKVNMRIPTQKSKLLSTNIHSGNLLLPYLIKTEYKEAGRCSKKRSVLLQKPKKT